MLKSTPVLVYKNFLHFKFLNVSINLIDLHYRFIPSGNKIYTNVYISDTMPVEQPLISQWFSSQKKSENEKDQVSKKKREKNRKINIHHLYQKKQKRNRAQTEATTLNSVHKNECEWIEVASITIPVKSAENKIKWNW